MCREGKGGVHPPIGCVLRLRQKSVQKEDDEALREAAREASRKQARGEEPSEPVTLADIQKAAQKKDPLRYWRAPFRWGPKSRYGPPLERLIPLMSTTEVLTVPVSGSKVEADEAVAGMLRVGIVD